MIEELIRQGAQITIASEGNALTVLRSHFPEINFVQIPGYSIDYPDYGKSFEWHFAKKMPALVSELRQEQEVTQFWVNEINPDAIISDNRYGVFNRAVKSIIITHQLQIKGSFLASLASKLIQSRLRSFDEIWIPDDNHHLSGTISRSSMQTIDIGVLSTMKPQEPSNIKREIGVVLSGLEPQRTFLEEALFRKLKDFKADFHMARGIVDSDHRLTHATNYMNRKELNTFIAESEVIICRSGYSSIMDLAALQKPAIIIPTPGQPEQEYLARHLHKQGVALHRTIETIDLERDIRLAKELNSWPEPNDSSLLEKQIKSLLESLRA